jgi:glycerol dehydrogenase
MDSQFVAKKFGCGRYIQEPNAVQCLGREALMLGARKALIIGGRKAFDHAGARIEKYLKEAGVEFSLYTMTSDCTYETLADLKDNIVPKYKADLIIGTGGGKVMDMSKAVAKACGLPLITLPTSVATFNCWSAMSVMYTADHKPIDRIWHDTEIDCAILDTQILAEAPVKLFASGMTDAFAKYIETGFFSPSYTVNTMPAEMYVSKIMAGITNEIILNKGEKAYRDCIQNTPTPEFEDCVLATVATTAVAAAVNYGNHALLRSKSGTGAPFAHGFYYAVRTIFTQEAWEFLHGELVGLALRAELPIYGASEFETKNFCRFLDAIGQPPTIRDVGIEPTDANIQALTDSIMVVWGKHPESHRPIIHEALHSIKG